jgi:hypothetical protein
MRTDGRSHCDRVLTAGAAVPPTVATVRRTASMIVVAAG